MKTLARIAARFGRGFAVSILLALSAKAAHAQPVPHFSYGPPAPNAGDIVSFFASAEGSVTSWSWNFGDGFTSTAQNPTHPFSSSGQKNVTLRTTNASGSLSVTTSIVVGGGKQNSIPDYSYSPLAPVANQMVAFTDASQFAVSYSWSFGDGGSSTSPSPSHKFTSQGTYTVTLTTRSSDGISNDSSRSISVAPGATGPTANFTFFPPNPMPGQTVSFMDTSTGSPTSWGWNFGDGSPVSNVQNPSHSFASVGTYSVTLTASNANGSSQITRSVSVGLAPVASFTVSSGTVSVGQPVTFTDTSTNNPTTWLWNFGDGSAVWTSQIPPPHPYASAGSYSVMLTVSNPFGTNSTTRTVVVTQNAVAASFTFSPASPAPNQPVSFTDMSTGSPTSWSWNFGDSATSTQRNPSHAFAAVGNYSVTLTASNASSSNSTTQTVRVSSSLSSVAVPVVAHVIGSGGVLFLTDLEVENTTNAVVTASLFFFPVGGGPTGHVDLNLGPRESRVIRDVVATLFGVTTSFGALRLDTQGAPAPLVLVKSRTYDESSAGSFGLSIPGALNSAPDLASAFVTGVQQNASYRTNVGAFNTTSSVETFMVILKGSDGTVVGSSAPVSLPAGGQWQLGIRDLFPTATGTGMTAEFRGVGGSAVPLAYGILADNLSGDLTYYPALRPAPTFYLSVISRITGVGGSLFKSEVNVSNTSLALESVTLTFLEHDRDNTSGARVATLTLGPGETRLIDDAVGALFGLSETFGAVKITSTGPMVAGARIYTNSPTSPGTVGQQVDPILADRFYRQGSIVGLRQDPAFRSNIGLVNPNVSSVNAGLTLFRGDGSSAGSANVFLRPLSMTQASLTGLFPGVSISSGERLTLHLDTGAGGAIAAYGIIADNLSQDLTTAPGQPLGATATPLGVWLVGLAAGGIVMAWSKRRR